MSPSLVVFRKELRDALRDRRSLMSLLIFPLIGPLLVVFLFNTIMDTVDEAQDITLPVVGAQYAPDLLDYLRQNGIALQELPAAAEQVLSPQQFEAVKQSISKREYHFALLIPEDFGERLAEQRSLNVELHFDSSRQQEAAKANRVQALIQGWVSETASLRLLARGISPKLLQPVTVVRLDVASQQARAQSLLGMIPMFVLMAAFISGVGIAVDATAGERERKSLEPLLVNPVPRYCLVLGKWWAASVFSVVGLVLVLSLNLAVLSRLPLEELGISFLIGSREIVGILLTTIPLGFFATALQLVIGLFARSFKDAQIYIGLLSLLPMLPFYYNITNNSGRELWMSAVPLLGQNMLLTDVVSGRTPALWDFALAAVCLLLWAGVFIAIATRLLKRERLIFA